MIDRTFCLCNITTDSVLQVASHYCRLFNRKSRADDSKWDLLCHCCLSYIIKFWSKLAFSLLISSITIQIAKVVQLPTVSFHTLFILYIGTKCGVNVTN